MCNSAWFYSKTLPTDWSIFPFDLHIATKDQQGEMCSPQQWIVVQLTFDAQAAEAEAYL